VRRERPALQDELGAVERQVQPLGQHAQPLGHLARPHPDHVVVANVFGAVDRQVEGLASHPPCCGNRLLRLYTAEKSQSEMDLVCRRHATFQPVRPRM
jgi:hypothetical protein